MQEHEGTPYTLAAAVDEAILSRRTHKRFRPEALSGDLLTELFELARWAPNHHLTQPWRFRVLGPTTLQRLKAAAGPKEAAKLDRAPVLVAVTAHLVGDARQDEEDIFATAAAVYAVLLAAAARGLASYWRSPTAFQTHAGRSAVGLGPDEHPVGLLHLGHRASDPAAKERQPVDTYLEFCD